MLTLVAPVQFALSTSSVVQPAPSEPDGLVVSVTTTLPPEPLVSVTVSTVPAPEV